MLNGMNIYFENRLLIQLIGRESFGDVNAATNRWLGDQYYEGMEFETMDASIREEVHS